MLTEMTHASKRAGGELSTLPVLGERAPQDTLPATVQNEFPDEHPSRMLEKVSFQSVKEDMGKEGFSRNQDVANVFLFAIIVMWVFAAQFKPEAFIYDASSFDDLVLFMELSFGANLIAIAMPLVLRHWPVGRWSIIGDVSLGAAFVSILVHIVLIETGSSTGALHIALSVTNHTLLGFSMGMVFCNWIRLYVRLVKNVALQVGLSLMIASLGCAALCFLPLVVDAVIVTVLPVLVFALIIHMRRVVKKIPGVSPSFVTEGDHSITGDKKLWIGVCFVGFAYGAISGYVMGNLDAIQSITPLCSIGLMVVGAGISIYCVGSSKNPGYSMPPTVLASIVCCGYALFAVFQGLLLPLSFAAVYCGQMLLECVLLMQLPRVYRRMNTLNTFFALYLAFKGMEFLGLMLRHLLMVEALEPYLALTSEVVTALLLCGGIIAVSYMSSGDAVSTAWNALPIPVDTAPHGRYSSACEEIHHRYNLTPREEEIMRLVGRGRNGTFIQEKLVISKSTYQTHMRNLYKKLDIHSDQELIDIIEDELNKISV